MLDASTSQLLYGPIATFIMIVVIGMIVCFIYGLYRHLKMVEKGFKLMASDIESWDTNGYENEQDCF